MKSIISSKDGEIEKTRYVLTENEANKSRLREVESTVVNKYEYEISRIKS